jgi:thermitase
MRILRVIVVLTVVAGTIVTAGASVGVPGGGGEFVPGELIVGLQPGADAGDVADALGGGVDRALLTADAHVLRVGNPMAAAALARSLPGVLYAEPNWIRRLHTHGTSPNDSDFHLKWDLHNDGSLSDGSDRSTSGADIGFMSAYDALAGASLTQTVVAILDTGIDAAHPDLNDKLVGGYDAIDGVGAPVDGYGHGTHVAGIAAAETNNGVGTAGVGFHPSIRIMPVKVCDDNGSCPSSAIADGVTWAVGHGAKVINMSFGGPESSSVEIAAFDSAHAAGVLLVASAGNSNVATENYPAAHPPVMAIAATDWADGRASYSNYGASWVDLAAPGGDMDRYDDPEGIYSTMPTYNVFLTSCRARGLLSPCYDLNYDQLAGTSMAAPQVAGAAALLFAMGAGDNLEVRELLETTAVPIPGTGTLWANGRLDIGGAVAAVGGVDPAPTITITNPTTGSTVSNTVVVTAATSDDVTSVEFLVDGVSIHVDDDPVDGWSAEWDTTSVGDGSRTVSAHASTAGGRTASASVTVLVDNGLESSISLQVSAYKVRGLAKADLSWSPISAGDVDIYRNGTKLITTANDGFHTDNIDARGGGSYTYQVCEAGSTTACSNEATASY